MCYLAISLVIPDPLPGSRSHNVSKRSRGGISGSEDAGKIVEPGSGTEKWNGEQNGKGGSDVKEDKGESSVHFLSQHAYFYTSYSVLCSLSNASK